MHVYQFPALTGRSSTAEKPARGTPGLRSGCRLCENDAMQRLTLTLETAAENLALDEALLDEAEATGAEFLRIWQSPQPIVVVGRSSRVDEEVNLAECACRGIPVLRRASGGAAIVAGPGCLMYAVVLSYERRPETRGIHASHQFVLGRLADSLRPHAPQVAHAGTSDLVLRSDRDQTARKFSGNSLRIKRTHFICHGTLLYNFDLSLISACLGSAPRQPDYRHGREHANFVTNLPLGRDILESALATAWPTTSELTNWPCARTAELATERYRRDDWNLAYGRPRA